MKFTISYTPRSKVYFTHLQLCDMDVNELDVLQMGRHGITLSSTVETDQKNILIYFGMKIAGDRFSPAVLTEGENYITVSDGEEKEFHYDLKDNGHVVVTFVS
jgi:hypothetical protein